MQVLRLELPLVLDNVHPFGLTVARIDGCERSGGRNEVHHAAGACIHARPRIVAVKCGLRRREWRKREDRGDRENSLHALKE